MRKTILVYFILAAFAFSGCQNSSDEFLTFDEMAAVTGDSVNERLTQGDFFAEDIAIIPEEDNVGEDELLTAGAFLFVDVTNQKIVYADHVYDKLYPASLSKLLTALVVLRYGELTDNVTISYNASHITEANAKVCGYEEGDIISLETLLNSLLVYSGNDAAIAIADHVGGSEEAFAKIMNEEARQIGAVHSNFVNSHGLHDDNQYSTAYDLYLIFNELMKFDTFRSIISLDSFTAIYTDKDGNEKQKTFNTTNLYLNGGVEDDLSIEIIGGKTGTTNKAGNCLILLCKDNTGKEYIAQILKATDRDQLYSQMSHLLSKVTNE
ncbi:MAG: D-alanyl-D-alanine carboxypeptidase family protein [Mobilitalea sp.]